MVKNPSWQEADQLAIYKRGRGIKIGTTEKQLQVAARLVLEPGTSGFQVHDVSSYKYGNDSKLLTECYACFSCSMYVFVMTLMSSSFLS